MSLGTLVIGINGQTQLLIDLTVLVAFALVIFVICLHAGILVRPDDAAATR